MSESPPLPWLVQPSHNPLDKLEISVLYSHSFCFALQYSFASLIDLFFLLACLRVKFVTFIST